MRAKSCRICCGMFMKTFEEKWTAWVDDELSEAERAEFEASLDDRAGALAEKNQAHCSGSSSNRAQCEMRSFFIISCAVALRRK